VFFFIYGIQSWFDSKISQALSNSLEVSEAYLQEHASNLKNDAYSMSKEINHFAKTLVKNPELFQNFLTAQAGWRNLNNVIVFRKKDILAKSKESLDFFIDFETIAKKYMYQADKEKIILILDDKTEVKALIKLARFKNTYLLISRKLDSKVLDYMAQNKNSFEQYKKLKENSLNTQIQFAAAYVGLSIILLLSAIWLGLIFASRIVAPIHKLIAATERVRSGDLTVRLEEQNKKDEVTTLFKAFNRMTGNLQKNQLQLFEVNKQIDERSRLIEAVFSGVNSGIVSIDERKRIKLCNKSALNILKYSSEQVVGRFIADIFPEITTYFSRVKDFPDEIFQQQIDIKRDGIIFQLLVRIVTEEENRHIQGYTITIDNISKLVSAQRLAAWSDVARRIAHEIRNPLTPINLSAERIRKKYEPEIADKENFNRYIDTIIRHSENIERIVREFSDFARMPEPVFKKHNFSQVIKDAVFSEKVVNSNINYEIMMPEEDIIFDFDKEQISRVFLNLLKNSAESIKESSLPSDHEFKIKIEVKKDKNLEIDITDTGKGFPPELINKLTEPYVTTREKGTGLGLAIVKKIIDDHNGTFELVNNMNASGKILGAKVKIVFVL
jgi:two-component system nitrogen regulation sensor histidine kinase NtrY